MKSWTPQDQPLTIHFTPGSRFSYSGEGFHFLQRTVEYIVQEDAHSWIQAQLLRPLTLTSATFTITEDDPPAAAGHDETGRPVPFRAVSQMGSAYSLHCTVVDFARFLCCLLQPPPADAVHLQPTTLAAMFTPHLPVNDSASGQDGWPDLTSPTNPVVSWGLGWGLQETAVGRAFWQWGDNGVYKAFALGYPDMGRGLVIFINSANGHKLWRPLINAFSGADQPGLDWLDRVHYLAQ